MDYFKKLESNPFADFFWNLPEQPTGSLTLLGGNQNSFHTEVKMAEFINQTFRLKTLTVALPDALKAKLPPLEFFSFLPSTDSGSFADSKTLASLLDVNDFNLLLGDFSKNSITAKALAGACVSSAKPTLLTRDTIDLLSEQTPEKWLLNPQLFIFASMPQLQKLFRAVYYPKVLLLSMSLMQVTEALHKFTLSYPVTLITLHNGQLVVAHQGRVRAVPLEKTGYSPIMLWSGQLACKIAGLNLFNPEHPLEATTAAMFGQ